MDEEDDIDPADFREPAAPNPTDSQEEEWLRREVPPAGGNLEEEFGSLTETPEDSLPVLEGDVELPETVVPELPPGVDMPPDEIDLFNFSPPQDPEDAAFTPVPDAPRGDTVSEATPDVFTDDLEAFLAANNGRLPAEVEEFLADDPFVPGMEGEFGNPTFPTGDKETDNQSAEAEYRSSWQQRDDLLLRILAWQSQHNREVNRKLDDILKYMEEDRL